MKLAPIVLFVYNRPWHTRQTIEALKQNELAIQSDLFVYCDAAQSSASQQSVQQVKDYIQSIDGFKSITIIKRQTNWGLASSIIDGVSTLVNEYGKVIVLEDDIVTSPFFLNYMNDALAFYKDDKQVWHISGYRHPLTLVTPDHFFLRPTSCWGWGTWSDRWKHYYKDSDFYIEKFDAHTQSIFNINNSSDYHEQITLNQSKKINTWAIFWYATVFFKGGLSLHPCASYVQNIGHDDTGTHCSANNDFDVELANKANSTFPEKAMLLEEHELALEKYFLSTRKSIVQRIFKKAKTIFRRND